MHREIVSILKNTYIQYGKDILSDKKKLEAYFSDLLVQYPREKRLLTIAAREDIFLHIFNDVEMNSFDKKSMYINVISSLYGVESKVASDVVEIIYASLVDDMTSLEHTNLSVEDSNAEKKEYIIKLINVLNNYTQKINNNLTSELKTITANMINNADEIDPFSEEQQNFKKRVAFIARLNGTTETEERELIQRAEKIISTHKNSEILLYDVKKATVDENKIVSARSYLEVYVRNMETNMKNMSFNHQLMHRSKIVDLLTLLYGEKIKNKAKEHTSIFSANQDYHMIQTQFEDRVKRVAFICKTTVKEELIVISKAEEILKTKDCNEPVVVYDLDGAIEDSKEILNAHIELNNYIRILYPRKSSAKPSEKYQIKALLKKLYGNKTNK